MSEPVVIQHNAAQSAAIRIQDAAGALAGCANLIEKLPPPSDPRHVPHAITASLLRDSVRHLAWVHELLNPSARGGSGQLLNVIAADPVGYERCAICCQPFHTLKVVGSYKICNACMLNSERVVQ